MCRSRTFIGVQGKKLDVDIIRPRSVKSMYARNTIQKTDDEYTYYNVMSDLVIFRMY